MVSIPALHMQGPTFKNLAQSSATLTKIPCCFVS